jgi:uncharacterized OB-fold protein
MSNLIRDEFRAGLARGELLLQHCNHCGKLNMYPRHACPHCQSTSLGWRKSAGRGVVHSFTVLRAGAPEGFEKDLPYALAVIKLDEGVQLLGRLLPDDDGDWRSFQCDDRVQFTPASSQSAADRPCAWFARVAA